MTCCDMRLKLQISFPLQSVNLLAIFQLYKEWVCIFDEVGQKMFAQEGQKFFIFSKLAYFEQFFQMLIPF